MLADWRTKMFNSCEDLHDRFRVIPSGKDYFKCKTFSVGLQVFYFFHVALTNVQISF